MSGNGLSKLPAPGERRTTSDYVTEALREAIISGVFADGEELNQVELANHFNVSRVPIREALRHLEAAGLVQAEAHRRAVVLGFTPERISEVFEIRALLETFMIERTARVITEQQLARLTKLCDAMDRMKDHDAWLDGNRRFHHQLLEPSGAVTAVALTDQLSSQVERYLRRSGGMHRPEEAGRQHREIVRALERRDAEKAKEVLAQHILSTRDRVLDSFEPVAKGIG